MVPIEMAFFFHSTPHGRIIALYPSPAGPTESLLALDTWTDIVESNPILNEMESGRDRLTRQSRLVMAEVLTPRGITSFPSTNATSWSV